MADARLFYAGQSPLPRATGQGMTAKHFPTLA